MFLKKRKSLFCIFAAFFAAVLLCVGAALLTTERQSARAAGLTSKIYWEISSDGRTLTISGNSSDVSDSSDSSHWFYDNVTFDNTDIPWRDGKSTVTRVVIKSGVAPVSTANWFNEFEYLLSIDLAELDTSKTTDMRNMFSSCRMLIELDLSGFKTSNVTDMRGMFSSCYMLTELDLSGFDTSNVTDMSGMFNACPILSYVDLSNFDMTNCTGSKISMIFGGCNALKKAKLSASFAASGAIFTATEPNWCSADGVLYNSDSNPKMSAAGTYYAEGNYQVNVTHGGESEDYYGIAKAWDAAINAGTATITMLADAEMGTTLTVAWRKNITLDLNGYMLKFIEGAEGSVIKVEGTFTLKDGYEGTDRKHEVMNVFSEEAGDTVSITGGVITGGNALRGGGVFVDVSGKFTMNGGTIAGNSADIGGGVYVEGGTFKMVKGVISYNLTTGGGGGAYVTYGGEFIMDGGTISGNGAYTGGGVYVDCGVESAGDSKFTMNGGTISGNSANMGGGVFNNGSLTVADNAKIIENSGSNVYLSLGKKITVAGALLSGAQIGVTLKNGYTGAFTQGYGENNQESGKVVSPGAYIISDDTTLTCIYADQTGEVCLGTHTGGTATCVAKAVCVNCKEGYGEVDSTNHTPNEDDGDCLTAITCKDCGAVVKAAGHTLSAVTQVDKTCTTDGTLAHDHCTVCGKDFIEGVEKTAAELKIAAGHTWDSNSVRVEPTCTAAGSVTGTCTACGQNDVETLPALGHDYSAGFTVDKAATCTEKGCKSKHCSRCDEKSEVTEIPYAEHSLTHVDREEATADAAGNTEYWSCTECGKYFSDGNGTTEIVDKSSVIIPKLSAPAKNNVAWLVLVIILAVIVAGELGYAGYILYKKYVKRSK